MIKLREYQREGVRLMDRFRGRALLADEMGLGKTIEILAWLDKHPKIRPAVVVCPAGVKYNWQKEARVHFGMAAYVCEGRQPPGRRRFRPHDLVIINYDILGGWEEYIKELKPRCMVIDECHYIKNRNAARTKKVRGLARRSRYRIGVSGTPQTNRPAELWPVLNLLAPESYNSFFSFSQEFCKPEKKPWGWVHTGAKNLPKLHAQLKKRCMIRRLKKDVEKDLPPKIRTVIPLKIRKPKEYAEARDNFREWLGKKNPERLARAMRAKAIVQMGYLKRLAARLKIRAVYNWAKDYLEETDGKLVLFGVHKKAIAVLHKKFKTTSVVIDGSVTGKDRQRAMSIFQRNPQYRLLIGNMKAAGVGVDGMQKVAASLAFFEMGWVPADHTQAEDRIHRIGQSKTSMIYYLVAMQTIEEKLCQIIQSKQLVQTATLDGGGGGDDLDVYDMLLREIGGKDG